MSMFKKSVSSLLLTLMALLAVGALTSTAIQMFGAFGRAMTESSVTFVSQALAQNPGSLELAKRLLPVSNTRTISKRSMKLNDATPRVEVDPETYEVRADGCLLTCEPAKVLALAQRYFLY